MKEIEEAEFLSLICDGSTDISVTEQEMVYITYSKAGDVKTKFLGAFATQKADAENITKKIQ